MKSKEFLAKFKGVIPSPYLSESKESYEPCGINEYCIEQECSYDTWGLKFNPVKNDMILDWTCKTTKKPNHKLFDLEVVRCLKYIGYKGRVKVNLSNSMGYVQKYVLNIRDTFQNCYEDDE